MTKKNGVSENQYETMSPDLDGSLPGEIVTVIFSEYQPSVLVASLYLGEGLYREIVALGGSYKDNISPEGFIELINRTSPMLARAEDEDLIIPAMVRFWKDEYDAEKN